MFHQHYNIVIIIEFSLTDIEHKYNPIELLDTLLDKLYLYNRFSINLIAKNGIQLFFQRVINI